MKTKVFDYFNTPSSCSLGKRVYKKLFYQNAKLTAYDKKIFKEEVDTIWWQYAFKPTTIPVIEYKDEKREYLEVALIEVVLKRKKHSARLSEVIHRAIPYPLVLVFSFSDHVCFSAAHKRFSEAQTDVIIAEDYRVSQWIDLASPIASEAEFLQSLDVTEWSYANFLEFYNSFVHRLLALESAAYTGIFSLDSRMDSEKRIALLAECRQIEEHIKSLGNVIKSEDHFNRQVEMNARIKELESQLERLSRQL